MYFGPEYDHGAGVRSDQVGRRLAKLDSTRTGASENAMVDGLNGAQLENEDA
jgi:hypothetical protein